MLATSHAPSVIPRNARRLGVIAVAFGVAIIGSHIESGRERWSAPAWSYALEAPGSPATWGVVILAAGLLILLGKHRIGYWIAFLWFCALAFTAGLALAGDVFNRGEIRAVDPLSVIAWTVFASMYRQQIDDERA